MIASENDLLSTIELAFADRPMPEGRIIEPSVDLSYHLEAQRVDQYMRTHKDVVDRSNHALVVFNYLDEAAALWILPCYMKSIINNYKNDDFMIDLIAGALASGMPGASYTAQDDLGCRMRKLATDREAKAVCEFCRWLHEKVAEPDLDDTFAGAFKLWCDSSAAADGRVA